MQILDRAIAERTVVSSATVAARRTECWRFLTEPPLLREWFADSIPIGEPGGATVELHFGDGDFFRVKIAAAEEPARLCWTWRFMGVGSGSEIEFRLTEEHGGTRIDVRDRGWYSESGAQELKVGWEDFLSRLRQRVETGKNTRYLWSETISASIMVQSDPESVARILSDPTMWRRFFPEIELRLQKSDDEIRLEFRRKEWAGVTTSARLSSSDGPTGWNLSVCHEGWLQLPENCRVGARKDAAESWAQALAYLESAFAH
jgi:uncharacterized protein YndB with AHSA1/START domain